MWRMCQDCLRSANSDSGGGNSFYRLRMRARLPLGAQLGLGDVNDERLKSSIAIVSSAFELAKQPDAAQVFDRGFLPPKAERMPPVANH